MSMLHKDLFEVQRKALEKGHELEGFCYFMEMGLGKTRTTLYDAYWHLKAKRVDMAIILCPQSLRGTWPAEGEEIGFPYPIIPLVGPADKFIKDLPKGPVVVVIHYDIVLTRGGDFIEAMIEAGKKIYIALDESTRIKNPNAKVGKYLIKLKDKFKYRRILSGSPAPQGPQDLWGQFQFVGAIDTKYFGFRNTYCIMGGWMGKQITGAQNLDILRARTDEFVFRAKAEDWVDWPGQIYPPHPREVEMTPRQRQAYLAMMHDFVLEWGDKEISAKMAVTAKTKLQQIGSGFLYDDEGQPVYLFDENEKNPKIEELFAAIAEVPTKVLVFYHFRESEKLLRRAAEKHKVNPIWLPSGLSTEEVEKRKGLFNTEDEYDVCFMQTASYKYGHTILGTETNPCHTTIFFENSYDGEARTQAEARNYRHGQKHPVLYVDIAISREDVKVIKALQKKEGLQEALLSEFSSYRSN